MSPRAREGGVGPAVLVAMLVVALIVGIYVHHERTPDLALEVPDIERLLGRGGEANLPVEVEFFVRFDDPHALVDIVGKGDEPVRTLADDTALTAEERLCARWDGFDDEGDPVPAGNYRLHVTLPEHDRDMVFPLRILVRRPPTEIDETTGLLPGDACHFDEEDESSR